MDFKDVMSLLMTFCAGLLLGLLQMHFGKKIIRKQFNSKFSVCAGYLVYSIITTMFSLVFFSLILALFTKTGLNNYIWSSSLLGSVGESTKYWVNIAASLLAISLYVSLQLFASLVRFQQVLPYKKLDEL